MINNEIITWSEENEDALIDLYFNCNSELYEDFCPFDDSIHHTDEQMLEFQENFDQELPSGFLEAVYTSLDSRCDKCFMDTEDCTCY